MKLSQEPRQSEDAVSQVSQTSADHPEPDQPQGDVVTISSSEEWEMKGGIALNDPTLDVHQILQLLPSGGEQSASIPPTIATTPCEMELTASEEPKASTPDESHAE